MARHSHTLKSCNRHSSESSKTLIRLGDRQQHLNILCSVPYLLYSIPPQRPHHSFAGLASIALLPLASAAHAAGHAAPCAATL
eukprot:681839-Amphidinium_carterae.1